MAEPKSDPLKEELPPLGAVGFRPDVAPEAPKDAKVLKKHVSVLDKKGGYLSLHPGDVLPEDKLGDGELERLQSDDVKAFDDHPGPNWEKLNAIGIFQAPSVAAAKEGVVNPASGTVAPDVPAEESADS